MPDPHANDVNAVGPGRPAASSAASSGSAVGQPLLLHLAGFTCTDWSGMGSRRGWFGSSTLPFLQWLSERLQFGEDAVIAENTLQFDLASLQEMVASHFTVDVLRVSPSLVGEPVERQRLYIIF